MFSLYLGIGFWEFCAVYFDNVNLYYVNMPQPLIQRGKAVEPSKSGWPVRWGGRLGGVIRYRYCAELFLVEKRSMNQDTVSSFESTGSAIL
jgi:hypothetical protein